MTHLRGSQELRSWCPASLARDEPGPDAAAGLVHVALRRLLNLVLFPKAKVSPPKQFSSSRLLDEFASAYKRSNNFILANTLKTCNAPEVTGYL